MSIAFGFVLVPFWLLIYCLIHLEVVSVFSNEFLLSYYRDILDSSYVYFVSILFSCCFVYGSIIRFQRSVFKCVDFGLFRISLRLSSASKSEGEKGEGRWIILRS